MTKIEDAQTVVSAEEAIKFLEGACRNWSKIPRLSKDDISDVAIELKRFFDKRAKADLSEAEPAQTVRKLTNLQKEITLLHIIDAMGGVTDSSDYPGNWITWFCSDEIHNVQDDTFNRCHEKGLLRTGHDSDTDTSTTYLTSAGKSALTQAAEPVATPPTSDIDALRAENERLREAITQTIIKDRLCRSFNTTVNGQQLVQDGETEFVTKREAIRVIETIRSDLNDALLSKEERQ